MKPGRKVWILAATVVVVFLAYRSLRPMTKVNLHIGEPMTDVLKKNDRPDFDPNKENDYTTLIWPRMDTSTETFDFTYDDPDGSIQFPHSRLIWVEEYAAIVTSISVSGSARKQTVREVSQEMLEVSGQFRHAGWKEEFAPPSLSTLTEAIQAGNGTSSELGVAKYTKNGSNAQLTISSHETTAKPDATSQADFILSVEFTNSGLERVQGEKVYEARDRVKGNMSDPLPLSYWMDLKR